MANGKIQPVTQVMISPEVAGEIMRVPRQWVENRYNVTHWTDPPMGGHFAAMEEPDLLVADVRKFFRGFRADSVASERAAG